MYCSPLILLIMGMNCCFVTFNGDTSQYLYPYFRDTIKFGIVYLVVLYLVIH